VARTPVTKQRLREVMEPYRNCPSDEAFEKMFERDKDELRSLGIPISVEFADKYFEVDPGYRIVRGDFELPAIELSPSEAAVVGLAARVWQHAGLASATSQALVKLKAAGLEVDREALDAVRPRLGAEEPSFEAMWEATVARRPVAFDYRRPGGETRRRHLQPWGVVTSRGRWYVVGLDTDRDEPRMFRLSRVEGEVKADGRAHSYDVPEGTDLRSLGQSLQPASPDQRAVVLARTSAAHGLRRWARLDERGVIGPDGSSAWDRLSLEFGDREAFLNEVLGFLDAVVVEEPAELREAVRDRLTALIETEGVVE
jgi:proteasome accessory factor B